MLTSFYAIFRNGKVHNCVNATEIIIGIKNVDMNNLCMNLLSEAFSERYSSV